MAGPRVKMPERRYFAYLALLLAAVLLNTAGTYTDDLIAAADRNLRPILLFARQWSPVGPAVLSIAAILLAESRAAAAESQKKRESAGLALGLLIGTVFRGEKLAIIRANVMRIERDKLVVLCHSPNMIFSGDKGLAFEKGQGCCGKAWQRATTLNTDARQYAVVASDVPRDPDILEREWLLTPDQIAATRDVRWIISIPLFEREDGSGDCRGVLNFDGLYRKPSSPRFFRWGMQQSYVSDARGVAKELRRLGLM